MTDRKRTAVAGLEGSSGHLRGALAAEISEHSFGAEAAQFLDSCGRVGAGTLQSRFLAGG